MDCTHLCLSWLVMEATEFGNTRRDTQGAGTGDDGTGDSSAGDNRAADHLDNGVLDEISADDNSGTATDDEGRRTGVTFGTYTTYVQKARIGSRTALWGMFMVSGLLGHASTGVLIPTLDL